MIILLGGNFKSSNHLSLYRVTRILLIIFSMLYNISTCVWIPLHGHSLILPVVYPVYNSPACSTVKGRVKWAGKRPVEL